jgi:hypothetical protein
MVSSGDMLQLVVMETPNEASFLSMSLASLTILHKGHIEDCHRCQLK